MVAEVIINSTVKSLNKIFDYNVPAKFAGTIKIGDRILVPFGRQKEPEEGFVVGFKDKSEYEVKDIFAIQEGFFLKERDVKLATWMARRYFCNISDSIKMMLPPGTTTKIIENRMKEKNMNFVFLKKDEDEINYCIDSKKLKSEKQIRTLKFLIQNDGILVSDLEMFADVSRNVISTLEKNHYIEIVEKQVDRNPFVAKNIKQDKELTLTNEQEKAYNSILDSIQKEYFKKFLIYGITGSRKNRNIFTAYQKNY